MTYFEDQPYPWAQPSLPALTMLATLPQLLQQQISCRLRAIGSSTLATVSCNRAPGSAGSAVDEAT